MIEQGYRGTWNPFTNENHFAEIETCVEEVCISYIFFLIVLFGTIIIMLLTLILCNISEIFYWALKAVPHPTMVTPRIFLPHTALKITRSRSASILFFCVFALFMYIVADGPVRLRSPSMSPFSVLYGCPEGPCDRQWARLSCGGRHTRE